VARIATNILLAELRSLSFRTILLCGPRFPLGSFFK
jgi:hypothetical protein